MGSDRSVEVKRERHREMESWVWDENKEKIWEAREKRNVVESEKEIGRYGKSEKESNIGVENGNGNKDVIREEKKWIKRQKDRERKGVKSVIKEADEISISLWISHLSLEISLLELLYGVVITI